MNGPGQWHIIIDSAVFAGCSRLPIEAISNLKLPWIQKKEAADWSLMSLETKQVKDANISGKHHRQTSPQTASPCPHDRYQPLLRVAFNPQKCSLLNARPLSRVPSLPLEERRAFGGQIISPNL